MKVKNYLLGVAAILLFAATNTASGQEPDDNGRNSHPVRPRATVLPDELPPDGLEIEGIERTEGIRLAQPPYTMSYQGYLTDDLGNPLNGTYDMKFALFNAAVGGTREWGQETHNGVEVTNGLFEVTLGSTTILYPHDFDEALWVKVWVNDEPLLPLQPLRAVPYAFALVSGAEVEGEASGNEYALWVRNTSTEARSSGVRAVGELYGLFAEEVGAGDVGIYSPDFVEAQGYRSREDSYFWVPGAAAALYPTTGCTLYNQVYGSSRLNCTTPGSRIIDIPISLPGVSYGQDVIVESMSVYYDLDNAGSYLSRTRLHKMTVAGQSDVLIDSGVDRQSTSPTSYTLYPADNYILSSASGPLNVRLTIQHDGENAHDVIIGGIRLRLGHQDPPE